MLELFTRVHVYLQDNKPQGEVASLDTIVATLGEVIETLHGFRNTQATLRRTGREQAVVRLRRTRRLIVGLMRPMARMARALDPSDVALLPALRVPRTLRTEELAGAATSMAEALAPRVDRLVAAGMAADALDKLTAAAEELRTMATTRALDGARRVASTEGIRETVQRGQGMLRLLDALVLLPLEANLSQRAEWRALMRLGRRGSVGAIEAASAVGSAVEVGAGGGGGVPAVGAVGAVRHSASEVETLRPTVEGTGEGPLAGVDHGSRAAA